MLSHVKDDFSKLSLEERTQLVEDLWDSIAADQNLLPLTRMNVLSWIGD